VDEIVCYLGIFNLGVFLRMLLSVVLFLPVDESEVFLSILETVHRLNGTSLTT
jgi:hypothetical protein